jgi:hypothetical protein
MIAVDIMIAYALVGLWFVVSTRSRGFVADVLFGALWPLYWYSDWKSGRL